MIVKRSEEDCALQIAGEARARAIVAITRADEDILELIKFGQPRPAEASFRKLAVSTTLTQAHENRLNANTASAAA